MELRQLKHFVAVAEELHFTRAAARVHVVQSTLSASINSLEQELGTALLVRNSRRVGLTAAGHALLPDAQKALAAVDNARVAVDAIRHVLDGHLDIGAVHGLELVELPAMLARYHQRYPRIGVTLRRDTVDNLVQATVDGDLDLAFVNRSHGAHGVNELPLETEPLVLAVPRDDPLAGAGVVALTDLREREFIDRRGDLAIRPHVDTVCSDLGFRRVIVAESNVDNDVVDLVAAGFGVAFVPPALLQNTDHVVGVMTEPAIPWELAVVTPIERLPSPAAAGFLDKLPVAGPGGTDRPIDVNHPGFERPKSRAAGQDSTKTDISSASSMPRRLTGFPGVEPA